MIVAGCFNSNHSKPSQAPAFRSSHRVVCVPFMNGGKQILQLEAKEKQHSSKVRTFFSRLLRLKTSQKELFSDRKVPFDWFSDF